MDEKTKKKLRIVELEILEVFHKFCVDNNLTYYLTYGTLLGAVRHQGFIPWDDDIDVFMPRNDYISFLELFKGSSLEKKYFLQNTDTEQNYHLPFSKIRKRDTLIIEGNHNNEEINQGIFIDIFPMDYSKKDKGLLYHLRDFITKQLNHIAGMRQLNIKSVSIICTAIFYLTKPLSTHKLLKISEWFCKLVKKGNYFVIYAVYANCEKSTFSKNFFKEPVLLSFEKNKFYVPQDYDSVLRKMYGDYMVIPPQNERYNHEISRVVFDLAKGE